MSSFCFISFPHNCCPSHYKIVDVILNDVENDNTDDPYELFSSSPKKMPDGPKSYGKSGSSKGKMANDAYAKK